MSHHKKQLFDARGEPFVRVHRDRRRAANALTKIPYQRDYTPSNWETPINPDGHGHELWLRSNYGYLRDRVRRKHRKIMKRNGRRRERAARKRALRDAT